MSGDFPGLLEYLVTRGQCPGEIRRLLENKTLADGRSSEESQARPPVDAQDEPHRQAGLGWA